jgi:mannose-1-phosphate guanylyltransferase/mannose-6-phosphate isomerase
MSLIKIIPVILCGGSGARLWPLSRQTYPKQFLDFCGDKTLFQQTLERVKLLKTKNIEFLDTLIVTSEEHRFLVANQLKEIEFENFKILLEPVGLNTAPALTFAALQAIEDAEDPILIVMPSDHLIKDHKSLNKTLIDSIALANNGEIVILGAKPKSPNTGFGYIKKSKSQGVFGDYIVTQFIEKPSLNNAKNFIKSGNYSWNSGIVVVKAKVWLDSIKSFRGDVYFSILSSFDKKTKDSFFIRPDKNLFKKTPSISIDNSVLENCTNSRSPKFALKMLDLRTDWNDLGSWEALWENNHKDKNGNFKFGDVILKDTKNSFIYGNSRLISLVGIENLVVIETSDVILIAHRDSSQDIKLVVQQLEKMKREEHINHRKTIRPWGWYDIIDIDNQFKVKRIQVNPGASLSLQSHKKRTEHWVVVKGEATVMKGNKLITLKENESTFITFGEKHRLSNLKNENLEIIEIQSGMYLGEDDIERFEDSYGRITD